MQIFNIQKAYMDRRTDSKMLVLLPGIYATNKHPQRKSHQKVERTNNEKKKKRIIFNCLSWSSNNGQPVSFCNKKNKLAKILSFFLFEFNCCFCWPVKRIISFKSLLKVNVYVRTYWKLKDTAAHITQTLKY